MRYDYREFPDRIIVKGGIIDKEMWKNYPQGKEFIPYEELAKAVKRRDLIPLVIEGEHDHTRPLVDARRVVGAVRVQANPLKRALNASEYVFYKQDTPAWVVDAIHRGEPLPLSPFKFVNVHEGRQEDILFDHVAILQDSTPRCSLEQGCGVGVYDSMTDEEKKKVEEATEEPEKPLSEPLSSKEPEKVKSEHPPEESEVQPDPMQELEALRQEKQALEDQLKAKEAELKSERDPLIGFLLQRGISRDAAEAMSLKDLQTTASALRGKDTQGLPGAVPAPTSAPKTYEEQKAESWGKFRKDLTDQSQKEFENW